jgi:hypothetical protein
MYICQSPPGVLKPNALPYMALAIQSQLPVLFLCACQRVLAEDPGAVCQCVRHGTTNEKIAEHFPWSLLRWAQCG